MIVGVGVRGLECIMSKECPHENRQTNICVCVCNRENENTLINQCVYSPLIEHSHFPWTKLPCARTSMSAFVCTSLLLNLNIHDYAPHLTLAATSNCGIFPLLNKTFLLCFQETGNQLLWVTWVSVVASLGRKRLHTVGLIN